LTKSRSTAGAGAIKVVEREPKTDQRGYDFLRLSPPARLADRKIAIRATTSASAIADDTLNISLDALTQIHKALAGQRLITRIHFLHGIARNFQGFRERGRDRTPQIGAAFDTGEGENLHQLKLWLRR
jgi:hypothetical protein